MSDDREAPGNADRASDADLDALLRELSARTRGDAKTGLKIAAWRATVRGSYALKRLIDILGSGIGMVLLSPVYLAIALAVKNAQFLLAEQLCVVEEMLEVVQCLVGTLATEV